jgi:RHS repeat-associated protein
MRHRRPSWPFQILVLAARLSARVGLLLMLLYSSRAAAQLQVSCPNNWPTGECFPTGGTCPFLDLTWTVEGNTGPNTEVCQCAGTNVFYEACDLGYGGSTLCAPNVYGCGVACRVVTDYNRLCLLGNGAIEPIEPCSTPAAESPAATGGSGTDRPKAHQPPSKNGANSVSTTTGAAFFTHTDAVVGDLVFARNFNSRRLFSSGAFGSGWNTSLEERLDSVAPNGAVARNSDGNPQYYFDHNSSGVFASVLPRSAASWITAIACPAGLPTPGVCYQRAFRAGGSETYWRPPLQYGAAIPAKPVSATDAAGVLTAYSYDTQGRLSSVSRLGRSIVISYQGTSTQPWKVLDGSATVLATYDYTNGNLTKVTYADGGGYQYAYDASGRVTSVRDLEDKMIEAHTYDASTGVALTSELGEDASGNHAEKLTFSYGTPQVTQVESSPGHWSTYQVQTNTMTDALGNITTYTLSRQGGMARVTQVSGPCSSCGGGGGGNTQSWTYDDAGNVLTYTDGGGHKWTYTYDPANTGDLLTETTPAPENAQTVYTYFPDGRVQTITRPDGGVTSYTYGPAGPLTITESITDTQSRTTTMTYTPQGKLSTIQDPRGKTTTLSYDASTFDLKTVTNPLQKTTTFGYDALGRRTSVKDALLHTTSTLYGDGVHVTSTINPDSTHTDFTYDKGGRRKTVTDPLGHVTAYGYDAYGRLQTVTTKASATADANSVTTYGYDLMSNLKTITDARNKVTTFEYDNFNRVKKVIYPPGPSAGGPFESVTYDPTGNLWTKTDRNGVVTTFTYDTNNRLTGKSYSDSTDPVTFTHDVNGRLKTASNSADSLTWTYDLAGQVRLEESLANGSAVTYDYDLGGNRVSMTLGGEEGEITIGALPEVTPYRTYTYDDASWLRKITRGENNFLFDYYDDGSRKTLTYPNGIVTTYTYDTRARLKTLTAALGATTVTSAAYTYDAAGNRLTKTMPDFSETYTPALPPDPSYRLGDVQRGGTTTEHYTYDPVGNRLSSLTDPTWIYGDRNELQSNGTAIFSYDLNGNLKTKSEGTVTWTYEWNAENQLTREKRNGNAVVAFAYDPLGRRVAISPQEAGNWRSTTMVYDGQSILRMTSGTTFYTTTTHLVHGPGIDQPLSREESVAQIPMSPWFTPDPPTVTYYHPDALGSIVARTDASGAVVTTIRYDAWGNVQAGAVDTYGFTGREWDGETGLYYYRARYYDPKIGRFIGEDPIGFKGGSNFYTYVRGNPIGRTDPSGLQDTCSSGCLDSICGYHQGCEEKQDLDAKCACHCADYPGEISICIEKCKDCHSANKSVRGACECACSFVAEDQRNGCRQACKGLPR